MNLPKPLKTGDAVGIISTARKISKEELQPCIDELKSWELRVELGETIGAEHFQFAGDDELRRKDFQRMLDDETIKAILFARGGYGTVRIIDEIDFRKFIKRPKWICGFSDATVIHSHLQTVFQVPTIHAPMAINFKNATKDSIGSLKKILFGEATSYEVASNALNRNGHAEGVLCGGNLSLLCSLNGTVSDIETDGKILFLEDIDEHLYHMDRMMISLKRSGKLENLAGLIVGHFSEMKNKDESNPFGKTVYEIIAEHVSAFDYPVCFHFPAGHEPDNRAMTFGVKWELNVMDDHVLFQHKSDHRLHG